MIEKRKHIRRFAAMNITCRREEKSAQQPLTCLLVNISKGGAAIECKNNFSVGEKIEVSFLSPQQKEVSVLMEILHSSPGGFGRLYGAKYNEYDLGKVTELNNYLLKYFNLY